MRAGKRLGALTLVLVIAPAAQAAGDVQAGDVQAGKGRFALCESCHGIRAEGNRDLGAPALAALQPWYVASQLEKFSNGLRGASAEDERGRQMQPMARTLADPAAIANVLAYLATIGPTASEATVAGDPVRGKSLYALCSTCHGDNAEGSDALQAPALRHSNDWYLLRQLENFRNGLRGAAAGDTRGAQMRAMAATLPDEQALRDVVAYVATLGAAR